MAYRRFNQVEYERCDPTAKDILVEYLNNRDVYTNAKETKGVDIKGIILTNGRNKYVYYECEIKKGWVGQWPERFKTVDIPYRKQRLIDIHGRRNLFFWVIAGDLNHAWQIHAKHMTEKHTGMKYTKFAGNEKFFQVPVEYCKLIKL